VVHHDGYGASSLCRQRRLSTRGHDQINPKLNQVRRKFRQAIRLLLGKPIFDDDVFFSTQPSLRISRQNAPNTNCPN